MTVQWTVCRTSKPQARCRLYVFPHSGGSPGEYLRWGDSLLDVEVLGIQLPGRGSRVFEQPFESMAELVEGLVAEVEFDPPFAFFGHSLGALIAHEVALALRQRGRPLPWTLFVSAIPAPHHGLSREPLHHLPDDEFIAAINRLYGGVPAEIADDPELLAIVMSGSRADFKVYERYRYEPRPPLDVPIYAFGGTSDDVTRDRIADWERYTTVGFDLTMLPGGHFYMREPNSCEQLLDIVHKRIEQAC
jgi:surfactin synthase thioesterase subunit